MSPSNSTDPHAAGGIDWCRAPAAAVDLNAREAAISRQGNLTKPPGALGRLEDIAIQLAALQGRETPGVDRAWISVFAADHGVAAAGVSAFPQEVTAQMIANMATGGAAISVLAKRIGAEIELIDLGTVAPVAPHPMIRDAAIAPATANLAEGPAMSPVQLEQALGEGAAAVERARASGAELYIAGEMGIGNTTAATALAAGLLGRPAAELVGPGTGLDHAGLTRKRALIDAALARHAEQLSDPAAALACLGGFEIAAMAGAYIACAQQGLPALVDGFISSAAALAACRLCPGAADWMLLAHASAEPGHQAIVAALGKQPLLDLGMRLGEGSGAAAAFPLLRLACQLHAEMATFAEAGVAEKAREA
ncbi:nicotinate-nucleotide--dimethylbenzimidazole phosphoribosyltransferase [Halochromatium glycolicum]|uniref:Nicotinate-nucleotide--dimethylbenzimidazole phosphoribosyltransferase n=1 Tax=Halochromatium glycolicum TaxID=85075 RepID=A0AAJ0X9M8_9GAMM|nr:nicotinate-nucleotide--dimethylbenzimidazole phosphoribosyltransferase [Halochromatium glycolicum]MBK1703927.1 nicotinate-nucleotide--dimethylbenzimidazole phosphoribosyltransferase [Halochromatium glycolicum]